MGLQTNGESVPPGIASRLNACSLRLESMGHPAISVASGVRSAATQEQIFRDRYIPVADAGGRNPYNDKRWWRGTWWVRVKAGGTVAAPGTSPHEDPPATAVDLAWPYNNRYTAAHAALIAICEEYGIRWTGRYFGEDWHFEDQWHPYATFASGGSTPFDPEEDEMQKADFEKIEGIVAAQLKNWTGYPDASYGRVQIIDENVAQVLGRIRGPLPWDNLQEIIRQLTALEAAVAANDPNSAVSRDDFLAVVKASEERLRATFESQFAEFGVALRAEIIAGLGDGASIAQIQSAFDEALRRLRLTVASPDTPAT